MLSKKSKRRSKKGQTKADFIRQRSNKTPAEIMADAKKVGVKLTMGQIYSQRSADKAKGKSGPGAGARKAGRRGGRGGGRRAAGQAGAEQQLRVAIAKLGLDRARSILDEVEAAFMGS
jgi:hypothetical protein